jgi:helicase
LAAIDVLLIRLEFGLPARALPLLSLPVSLSRGQYLALVQAGAVNEEAVHAMPAPELSARIGAISAGRLKVALEYPAAPPAMREAGR